jgi:hypothetical protein
MSQTWTYWRADLKEPQNRDITDPGQGYWRHKAAKTRVDWPIAIWFEDEPVIKVGNKVTRGNDALLEFLSGSTWLNAVAVSHADYLTAMETGKWPIDGKPARHMDDAEKHDIDISAGDNDAPIDQTLAEQIDSAVAKASAITSISTEAEAKAANELADKLATLFKLGDAERAKEKAPFDQGAKDVQAKWLPIINPASEARERLVGKGGLVKKWLLAEQQRLDAETAEARRAQEAEAERIRQENEKRAAEAAEAGEDAPAPIPQPDPVPAAEPQRARAGNSFGRATGLRKITSAEIIDIEKLLLALKDHREMKEMAQTLANRAAKAGIELAGMKIKETME